MARMRSLKPEFWLDRKLARLLSRDERMLYLGLWNQADEHGRALGDARLIKGQVFPFDDDITDESIEAMLKALAAADVVQIYEYEGDPYLFLPKLGKHQRLEPGKVPSRHPEPPERPADQQVCAPPESDPDDARTDPSGAQTDPGGARAKHVAGSREHVAGRRGADESAQTDDPPPKPSTRGTRLPDDFDVSDELRQWARALGFTDARIDAITEAFRDYWRGAPGQRGVKLDWPGTWRNWLRREAEKLPARPSAPGSGEKPSWEL